MDQLTNICTTNFFLPGDQTGALTNKGVPEAFRSRGTTFLSGLCALAAAILAWIMRNISELCALTATLKAWTVRDVSELYILTVAILAVRDVSELCVLTADILASTVRDVSGFCALTAHCKKCNRKQIIPSEKCISVDAKYHQ
jgi:hypothetical protein